VTNGIFREIRELLVRSSFARMCSTPRGNYLDMHRHGQGEKALEAFGIWEVTRSDVPRIPVANISTWTIDLYDECPCCTR
jgi:hypothetical protein